MVSESSHISLSGSIDNLAVFRNEQNEQIQRLFSVSVCDEKISSAIMETSLFRNCQQIKVLLMSILMLDPSTSFGMIDQLANVFANKCTIFHVFQRSQPESRILRLNSHFGTIFGQHKYFLHV
jgi:hypothetical protein